MHIHPSPTLHTHTHTREIHVLHFFRFSLLLYCIVYIAWAYHARPKRKAIGCHEKRKEKLTCEKTNKKKNPNKRWDPICHPYTRVHLPKDMHHKVLKKVRHAIVTRVADHERDRVWNEVKSAQVSVPLHASFHFFYCTFLCYFFCAYNTLNWQECTHTHVVCLHVCVNVCVCMCVCISYFLTDVYTLSSNVRWYVFYVIYTYMCVCLLLIFFLQQDAFFKSQEQ